MTSLSAQNAPHMPILSTLNIEVEHMFPKAGEGLCDLTDFEYKPISLNTTFSPGHQISYSALRLIRYEGALAGRRSFIRGAP
jgi:hypothetical protein